MQGVGWIDLIRRIPVNLHNQISFATANGSEIMVQDILRIDNDYLLLRGRMGGSQEAGKIIVLPYDQIVNLAVNKILKESEVQKIFGTDPLPAKSSAAESSRPQGDSLDDGMSDPRMDEHDFMGDAPQEASDQGGAVTRRGTMNQTPAPTPENSSAPRPAEVSKSVLLARLRQRLAEQSKQSP